MDPQQLTLLALQISIFLVVFGYGLRTSSAEVLYLVRRPSLFARSLLAMFVVMPLLAVALAKAFELRPAVEIAIVALAVSPIPPMLPNRGIKAGGRAAYALGLMALSGLMSIVIVPIGVRLVGLAFDQSFAMPAGVIAGLVLKTVLAPLASGLIFHAIAPKWAERIRKPIWLLSMTLLGIGAVLILAAVTPGTLKLIGHGTLLAMVAFIGVGLLAGHCLGGAHQDDRTVLALSTASRHPAIALSIAKANFPEESLLGAAIALYLVVGLVVGAAYLSRRRSVVAAPSPS
jgi:BASS family bile acid:Na+ symporter